MTKRKRDEELPAEEDEVEAKEDEVKEKFIVNVKSHVKCDICRYKIKDTLENPAPPVEFADLHVELPNRVNAVVIKEFSVRKLRTDFEKRFGMEVEVNIDETNCDDSDSDTDDDVEINHSELEQTFDVKAYCDFRDSLATRIAGSSNGIWGSLFKSNYSQVFKVYIKCGNIDNVRHGNAFLVEKDPNYSLFLTCGTILRNLDTSWKVILVGPGLKTFEATVTYVPRDIDFGILRVKNDLGIDVSPLHCSLDELGFGDDIFAICSPHCHMNVPDEYRCEEQYKGLLDTIWYTMLIGTIAHPWLVGMHSENEHGELLMLNVHGLTQGAAGAPIMNDKGEAIGILIPSR